jgi:hypothetical protein
VGHASWGLRTIRDALGFTTMHRALSVMLFVFTGPWILRPRAKALSFKWNAMTP